MTCLLRRSLLLFCVLLSVACVAEPLAFRRAMELALQRGAASVAAADQQRAHAAYLEARNMYLPQVTVGSGLAKTYGYPLSIEGAAPSVFSVNYQSFLLNFAQRDFIRSAHQQWLASATGTADQRAAVLLETAVTYVQLDTLVSRLRVLQQQQDDGQRLVQIVADRVREGVDSDMELTRAKLDAARVKLRVAEAAGAADVLRERLAQLTGLPAPSIETITESIPSIPDVSDDPNLVATVVSGSPAVKAAEENAAAQQFRARGEHRQFYPAIDLVAQYGYFTRFNNYDKFFLHFQTNNATIGVAIRFPFLNFAQRARAEGADADALKARRQIDLTRQQVSTDAIRLARTVRQLAAADEVAKLDFELSQAQAQAVQTRIQAAAPAQATAPAPGPRDLQAARIETGDKFSTYLDTAFEFQKAKLELLRAMGKLEDWAAPRGQ